VQMEGKYSKWFRQTSSFDDGEFIHLFLDREKLEIQAFF